MLETAYGLNYPIKSFAISNDFVTNTNKACYKLGQNLTPFCIFANQHQKDAGVLDFATFNGFVNTEVSLLQEIAEYRHSVYEDIGVHIKVDDLLGQKLLLFDYLMSISLCYVEVPKWVTKDGRPTETYDKFFVTRNPQIMATWMGSSAAEMQAKYSARIAIRQMEVNENSIKFVKLMHSGKGNTISVPRTAFSVENMTCTPLYMINAFVQGIKPHLETKILEFTMLKDNQTERVIDTTLSEDIMRRYYDNMFISQMLSGVDIDSVELGGLKISSKLHRGYIKIPELGSSKYDATGCRSLNVVRLLKCKEVTDIDTTFINVDLNSVVQNFKDALDYVISKNPQYIYDIYKKLTGNDIDTSKSVAEVGAELGTFVDTRFVILSTTFQRDLHKFMISNPEWFPTYTGLPNRNITSSATTVGVIQMDF